MLDKGSPRSSSRFLVRRAAPKADFGPCKNNHPTWGTRAGAGDAAGGPLEALLLDLIAARRRPSPTAAAERLEQYPNRPVSRPFPDTVADTFERAVEIMVRLD